MKIKVQSKDDPVDRMVHQMGNMMKDIMDSGVFRLCGSGTWEPCVNVYEVADRWLVCVELAGMKAEEIDLSTADGLLIIRGSRSKPDLPESPESVSVHMMEIDSGQFLRRLEVPTNVDADGIEASFRNGYLWITLPTRRSGREGRGR